MTSYNILGTGAYLQLNKTITKHLRSIAASALLSYLVDKENYHLTNGGIVEDEGEQWFYATSSKIEDETFLSYRKQKSMIKLLEDAGLIRTKVMGLPAKVHFSIDHNLILHIVTSSIGKTQKLDVAKRENIYSKNKVVKTEEEKQTQEACVSFPKSESVAQADSIPTSNYSTANMNDFLTAGEKCYDNIHGRIKAYFTNEEKASALVEAAGCKMDAREFNSELTGWIRHNMTRQDFYCNPIKFLRGGKGNFYSWISQPFKPYHKNSPARIEKELEPLKRPTAEQLSR